MGWIQTASAAIVLLWPGVAAAQTPGHPHVEAFGQLPDLSNTVLSPDGTHVAVLQSLGGRPVLCIYTIGATTTPAIVRSDDWIIGDVRWVKNDRLILYLTKDAKLGAGYEHSGRLASWGRAVSVDLSGGNQLVLFKHNVSLANNGGIAEPSDIDLDDPDNIYIPFYVYSNTLTPDEEAMRSSAGKDINDMFRFDLFKVNVRTGDDTKFEYGDYGTREWFMDGRGHIVGRVDRDVESLEGHLKLLDKDEWRDVMTADVSGGHGTGILGLSDDGTAFIRETYSEDGDTDELVRVDMAAGKETVLFKIPHFDIAGGVEDEWTGRIVGASYIDDRHEYVYFDPKREALQRGIEAAFPGLSVAAASIDVARNLVIVDAEGPRNPPAYYLLDRVSHQATLIGKTYPDLEASDLGEMKPYSYTARDGLAIPAYLTLPPGKPAKNLPTVIFPHGGPADRDEIGFDWWAQFMANRGYAVLQPNFRGSTGYGRKFQDAGNGQWGLKMQDDITDGVKKLIADGIADPKRICIVGASYGGYAALAGATFTPDLYACAVSFAGVSDTAALIRYVRSESDNDAATRSYLQALHGSDEDSEQIRATSPVRHADQVRCPILLLHGENDTTVPIAQSEAEEAALQSAGKKVTFVRIPNDDHHLLLAATRVRTLKEIESFLAANIGS